MSVGMAVALMAQSGPMQPAELVSKSEADVLSFLLSIVCSTEVAGGGILRTVLLALFNVVSKCGNITLLSGTPTSSFL